MIISTREYLGLIKRGTTESIEQYKKEIERLNNLLYGPCRGIEMKELDKIKSAYAYQVALYEKERAKCMINIQHLPTRNQSSAVYMYVMADKSWEQISIDRCTTFEAARSLVLRGFESYERLYGANQEIDERIYRA